MLFPHGELGRKPLCVSIILHRAGDPSGAFFTVITNCPSPPAPHVSVFPHRFSKQLPDSGARRLEGHTNISTCEVDLGTCPLLPPLSIYNFPSPSAIRGTNCLNFPQFIFVRGHYTCPFIVIMGKGNAGSTQADHLSLRCTPFSLGGVKTAPSAPSAPSVTTATMRTPYSFHDPCTRGSALAVAMSCRSVAALVCPLTSVCLLEAWALQFCRVQRFRDGKQNLSVGLHE